MEGTEQISLIKAECSPCQENYSKGISHITHWQAVSGMINMNLRLSGSIGTKTCKSII